MAKADWTQGQDSGFNRTANERIADTEFVTPDAENKAAALAAGVKDAAYIRYAEALTAYENREDIELLADKQTRDRPEGFGAGAFMRELPNRSGGLGIAPGPGNDIVVDGYTAAGDPDDDSDGRADATDTDDSDPRV